MSAAPTPTNLERDHVLWWPLLLLAGASIAVFVIAASQRVFYPFELEWMEGALADHASRVADGLPLYCEPTAEHVPFLYAPLLFWLGGLGMKLGIDGIIALRLVAAAFSIGSAMLIGHWVRRETGRMLPGLAAVGLFFAGYGWLAWWYDLARNDSLFVFFSLATSYQLRHGGDRRWLWAGLLAAMALLAKQSTLMWLPAVGVGALLWDWRCALRFGLVAAVTMAASMGALHLLSDGWSTFYLFEMPQHHGWVGDRKLGYWIDDLVPMYPLLTLALIGFVANVRRARGTALYLAAFGSGGLMCSWFSRMHVGGFENVMMYGFAAACVLGPIAASSKERGLRVIGPVLLLMQFGWLGMEAWQRPTGTLLPSEAHEQAHADLRAFVAKQNGPVWIPGHGHIAYREGKGTGAHGQAIFDLLQMLPKNDDGMLRLELLFDTAQLTDLPERNRQALASFMADVTTALSTNRFAALVIDEIGTGEFPGLFALGLAGADGRPGTDDDPYQRLPGSPLRDPRAIDPLIGRPTNTPYVFARR